MYIPTVNELEARVDLCFSVRYPNGDVSPQCNGKERHVGEALQWIWQIQDKLEPEFVIVAKEPLYWRGPDEPRELWVLASVKDLAESVCFKFRRS